MFLWLHALPSCCQKCFYGWVATSIPILLGWVRDWSALSCNFPDWNRCSQLFCPSRPSSFHFYFKTFITKANVDWQTLILLSTIQPEVEISINEKHSPATCSSVSPYSDCGAARKNINRNDKFISKFPCFGCAAINSGLKSTRKPDKFRAENSVICWVQECFNLIGS